MRAFEATVFDTGFISFSNALSDSMRICHHPIVETVESLMYDQQGTANTLGREKPRLIGSPEPMLVP